MYSLPITTYTDYWRTTRLWSTYFGTTVALLAGTSFSGLLGKMQEIVPSPAIEQARPAEQVLPRTLAGTGELKRGEPKAVAVPRPPVPSARIAIEYRIEDVKVPVPVEYRETSTLPPGMTEVREEGSQGLKREVIKVVRVGGSVEQEVVNEFLLNRPKKRVIMQNSKQVANEPVDLAHLKVAKAFTVEATAYTYTGDPTASGVYPRKGLIAVDPKVIPMGSRVYLEGYGYAIAADTGGAIRGNKVDLFFPSLRECIDWGRRPIQLYLLAKG